MFGGHTDEQSSETDSDSVYLPPSHNKLQPLLVCGSQAHPITCT